MKREHLKEIRLRSKLTQEEVAKAIGISKQHYSRLEAGTSEGSVGVWQKLKNFFRVKSIDDLLEPK